MDIDDIEGSNSYSLKDIAGCSTLLCENTLPFCTLGGKNLNQTYMSRDVIWFQLLFWTNKSTLLELVTQYHCYMNPVIQLLFSIHRTIGHNFQFISSTEGSLSEFLFETAHSESSSTDVKNLDWYNMIYSTVANFSWIVRSASWCY